MVGAFRRGWAVDERAVRPYGHLPHHLRDALDRGVTVVVGGLTDDILSRVRSELPAAEVFETGLEWLVGPGSENEVAISRVLLTDRTSLLVSSFYPTREGDDWTEQAVFATGLENGLVVIVRRLLSTGLLAGDDPAE